MKKLFTLLVVMIFAISLYACDKKIDLELEPPTNVQINDGIITWDAVTDVEEYIVVVGTQEYTVTTNQFNLTTLQLSVGSYPVHVLSKKGDKVSLPSSTVNYVVEDQGTSTDLGVPQNVTLVDGVLSWSAVPEADSYVVSVGSETYTVTTLSFDLNTITLPTGVYNVSVRAKRGTELSASSTPLVYTVSPVVTVGLVTTLLKMVDPDYEDNLTIDDFEDEWEFESYYMTLSFIEAYALSTTEIGMTDLEAVAMFAGIMQMVGEMEEANGPEGLFILFDAFEFGLDSDEMALLIFNLASVGFEMIYRQNERDVVYYEEQTDEAELALALALSKADLAALFVLLEDNLPIEFADDFAAFISFELEPYDYWDMINTIQYNILPDIKYGWNDPYFLDYSEYAPMFYAIFSYMFIENPDDFDDFYMDTWEMFDPYYFVINAIEELNWRERDLERAEQNLVILTDLQALWADEPQLFMELIENALIYIQDLYAAFDMDLLDLLGGDELSIEEIFILKDEFVTVLLETLPGVEAFETLYEAMILVGSVVAQVDLSAFLPYTTYLATIDHKAIELMLLFADSIDQATFEEIMLLADNLFDEVLIEDEWGSYYKDVPNVDNIVDLMLLILNHIDEFNTEQSVKIAALGDAIGDVALQNFIITLLQQAKLIIVENMDEDQAMLVSFVIDEVIVDVANYYNNVITIGGLTIELFREFMNSEGQIVYDILALQTIEGLEETTIALVQTLIVSIMDYTTIVHTAMDLAAIENLLRLSRVPLKTMIMMEEIMALEDFDTMFEELLPLLAQILFNIGLLEQHILTVLSTTEHADLLFDNDWDLDPQLHMFVVITYILNDVFDETYAALVFDTLDIFFDEVLAQDDLALILSMMEFAPADMKLYFIDMIVEKLDAIEAVMLIDFTQTEEADVELLMSIFDFLFKDEEESGMTPE